MAEVGQRRFVLLLVRRTDVKWLYTHSSQTETFTLRGSLVWRLDHNKCQFNAAHASLSLLCWATVFVCAATRLDLFLASFLASVSFVARTRGETWCRQFSTVRTQQQCCTQPFFFARKTRDLVRPPLPSLLGACVPHVLTNTCPLCSVRPRLDLQNMKEQLTKFWAEQMQEVGEIQ